MTLVDFALLLGELGNHAAEMQANGEPVHDGCLHCQTAILLARVVRFGGQLREIELQELHP